MSTETKPVQELSTTALVNAYADSRVWFALNETTGPTTEGNERHRRHCAVVDELRNRGVMDR